MIDGRFAMMPRPQLLAITRELLDACKTLVEDSGKIFGDARQKAIERGKLAIEKAEKAAKSEAEGRAQ